MGILSPSPLPNYWLLPDVKSSYISPLSHHCHAPPRPQILPTVFNVYLTRIVDVYTSLVKHSQTKSLLLIINNINSMCDGCWVMWCEPMRDPVFGKNQRMGRFFCRATGDGSADFRKDSGHKEEGQRASTWKRTAEASHVPWEHSLLLGACSSAGVLIARSLHCIFTGQNCSCSQGPGHTESSISFDSGSATAN